MSEPRVVRLTIPATPEYIALGRLTLAGISRVQPLPDETLADLKLALTEACTNSVRHAYAEDGPGTVEIVFELEPAAAAEPVPAPIPALAEPPSVLMIVFSPVSTALARW